MALGDFGRYVIISDCFIIFCDNMAVYMSFLAGSRAGMSLALSLVFCRYWLSGELILRMIYSLSKFCSEVFT